MLSRFIASFLIYLVLKIITVILSHRYGWAAWQWFILDSLIAAAVIAWGVRQS